MRRTCAVLPRSDCSAVFVTREGGVLNSTWYKFGGRARGRGRFRARTAKIGFFPQFQLSVCRGGRPRGGGPHQGLFCPDRYVGRSYAGRERRAPPARCSAGRSRARSGAFCGRIVSYSLHSLQRVQNYQPPWLGQNAPKSDFGVISPTHTPPEAVYSSGYAAMIKHTDP